MSKYIFTKDWGESPLIGEMKKGAPLKPDQIRRLPKDTIDEWLRINVLREVMPKREETPKRKPEVKRNGRK
jgi:hypothetical protein